VNSIRDELVAFDTNVFLFALSKHPSYPACETLVFDRISELKVYIPLQIFVELQRNLHNHEMNYPATSGGYQSKNTSSKIVGWVEAHCADTHRRERWVSLTLNPSYPESWRNKLHGIGSVEIKKVKHVLHSAKSGGAADE